MLKLRLIVLLLTPLLQLLLLKLRVHLLIVLLKLLLQLKELPIRHWPLRQKPRLAAKRTERAWNVCSKNRCLSSTTA